MPVARHQLINQAQPAYYHIYSRCVQQERLCGYDPKTQKDYSHRKHFMVKRLHLLTSIFPVDSAAYSIMDDHYHLNVFHNPERVDQWEDETIVHLWLTIHQGPGFMRRWYRDKPLRADEYDKVQPQIDAWRSKLKSLSYFMKCFNEKLSKEFNKESGKKGAFWEERFRIKQLHNERDLLMCMSYVELNPVHAGIADTPEQADYTSYRERQQQFYTLSEVVSEGIQDDAGDTLHNAGIPVKWLMPFKDQVQADQAQDYIHFTYSDYCELVHWLGQSRRDDKAGFISDSQCPAKPDIADRLAIQAIDLHILRDRFKGYGWYTALAESERNQCQPS